MIRRIETFFCIVIVAALFWVTRRNADSMTGGFWLQSALSPVALPPLKGEGRVWSSLRRWALRATGGEVESAQVDQLRDENQRLNSELLQCERQRATQKTAENLAALQLKHNWAGAVAEVISPLTSFPFRVLRIQAPDEATASRWRPGLIVIAQGILVGRTHRLFGRQADVLMLCDPRLSVDAWIVRADGKGAPVGRGMVRGRSTNARCRAEMDYVVREAAVKVGDMVIASGIGGIPKNVKIGQIAAVRNPAHGFFQEVELDLAMDPYVLDRVLVLDPEKPAETPASEEAGQSH